MLNEIAVIVELLRVGKRGKFLALSGAVPFLSRFHLVPN